MNATERHRYVIPQPMGTLDAPQGYLLPKPVDGAGQRIQVTAFTHPDGFICERWQFSDTEVVWYKVEEKELPSPR